MKHLKQHFIYERSEAQLSINIKDILIGLEDNGFNIRVDQYPDFYIISIYAEDFTFKYSDISEEIDHLFNYMKDVGYYLQYVEIKRMDKNYVDTLKYKTQLESESYQEDLKRVEYKEFIKLFFRKIN